jgi:hypothetical protein
MGKIDEQTKKIRLYPTCKFHFLSIWQPLLETFMKNLEKSLFSNNFARTQARFSTQESTQACFFFKNQTQQFFETPPLHGALKKKIKEKSEKILNPLFKRIVKSPIFACLIIIKGTARTGDCSHPGLASSQSGWPALIPAWITCLHPGLPSSLPGLRPQHHWSPECNGSIFLTQKKV